MDDPFDEIEAELKRLRPLAPSAELMVRLETEMATSAHKETARPRRWSPAAAFPWMPRYWPLAAGLAAACMVAAFWGISRRAQPESADRRSLPPRLAAADPRSTAPLFKPVSATDFLYATVDEGLVSSGDSLPARRVSYRYVDTYTWRNTRTNASVKWMIPREELRVVPVSAY